MVFGWVTRVLGHVASTVQAFDFTPDEALEAMARAAYQRMVEWFGPPSDAGTRVRVVRGPYTALGRDRLTREYVLIISSDLMGREQQIAAVAHEMCHRVVGCRKGLVQQLWVAEMLALVAEQHFLREHGMSQYAGFLMQAYAQDACALSPAESRRAARARNPLGTPFGVRRRPYPPGFTSGVAILGDSLERLVGWYAMCSMVGCTGLDDWLRILPDDRRASVRSLLGVK